MNNLFSFEPSPCNQAYSINNFKEYIPSSFINKYTLSSRYNVAGKWLANDYGYSQMNPDPNTVSVWDYVSSGQYAKAVEDQNRQQAAATTTFFQGRKTIIDLIGQVQPQLNVLNNMAVINQGNGARRGINENFRKRVEELRVAHRPTYLDVTNIHLSESGDVQGVRNGVWNSKSTSSFIDEELPFFSSTEANYNKAIDLYAGEGSYPEVRQRINNRAREIAANKGKRTMVNIKILGNRFYLPTADRTAQRVADTKVMPGETLGNYSYSGATIWQAPVTLPSQFYPATPTLYDASLGRNKIIKLRESYNNGTMTLDDYMNKLIQAFQQNNAIADISDQTIEQLKSFNDNIRFSTKEDILQRWRAFIADKLFYAAWDDSERYDLINQFNSQYQ